MLHSQKSCLEFEMHGHAAAVAANEPWRSCNFTHPFFGGRRVKETPQASHTQGFTSLVAVKEQKCKDRCTETLLVYMYTYMYIYIYTYTHVCIYVYLHIYI